MVEFNADAHEYRLAGRKLPSVTQVIGTVLPGWQAGEWYLQRGRALHHACRLLDEGTLDRNTVHDEIGPRVRAWERFIADSGCRIVQDCIERRLASVKYGFAGTCDRVIDHGSYLYVCDLKSTIAPQVVPQLGAYSILLRESDSACSRAVAVELRDDGEYRTKWLNESELRRAEQTFLAILTVFNFMQAHKLKGPTQ